MRSLLALLVKGAWALCTCPVGMSVILPERVNVAFSGRKYRAKELQEVQLRWEPVDLKYDECADMVM